MKRSAALVAAAAAVTLTAPAGAAIPALYKNCTNLNKKYPHGVGRTNAIDKTSGTPVRNFKRSNSLYRTAMSYNRGLDRDGDKIACEKR